MITHIVPLGTASALPTRERHLAALAVERKGRVLLFDCGEGTQFRLIDADLNRARIDAIFITHMHGDHLYGLFGLLATIGNLGRRQPLHIIGPKSLKNVVWRMPGLEPEGVPFDIHFVEIGEESDDQIVFEDDEFIVRASALDHRVLSAGFRLDEHTRPGRLRPETARQLGAVPRLHFSQLVSGKAVVLENGRTIEPDQVLGPTRPGISFAYMGDTRPCEAALHLGAGADLMYHEATFAEDMKARADETGHSTARQAAEIARKAGARRLLIGHFSARYASADPLVSEARTIFENTEAAEELKRYALDPRLKWEES